MAIIIASSEWYGAPLVVFRHGSSAEEFLDSLKYDHIVIQTEIPDTVNVVFVVSSGEWYGSHCCSKCNVDFQATCFLTEAEAEKFISIMPECVDYCITEVVVR